MIKNHDVHPVGSRASDRVVIFAPTIDGDEQRHASRGEIVDACHTEPVALVPTGQAHRDRLHTAAGDAQGVRQQGG
jgi:hypothetical protein